jgi:D-alanine-D-alanine ligase
MKICVALFFGGQSVEHEVSVITGLQAYYAFDKEQYDVVPVYISKDNEMYIGEKIGDIGAYKNIPALLAESTRVNMVRENGKVYLREMHPKTFHKPESVLVDVAFPAVHGTNVEDGTLQGFFRTMCIPYVGCDVTASALGMDKFAMKAVLNYVGVPVLPCVLADSFRFQNEEEALLDEVEEKIGYPVIVKPVNLGSSVGIKIAHDREGLMTALDEAFGFAMRVLVEKAITNLKEINCSVLGDVEQAEASECESPVAQDEILSYKDKYMSGGGEKTGAKNGGSTAGSKSGDGMASLSRELPAKISPEVREQIRQMSVKTFQALGCNGVARIDCMLDQDTGKTYVNEINTIPGSLSFYLWEPVGLPYDKLLDRMVKLALKRDRELSNLSFSFDTNLLSSVKLGGAKK